MCKNIVFLFQFESWKSNNELQNLNNLSPSPEREETSDFQYRKSPRKKDNSVIPKNTKTKENANEIPITPKMFYKINLAKKNKILGASKPEKSFSVLNQNNNHMYHSKSAVVNLIRHKIPKSVKVSEFLNRAKTETEGKEKQSEKHKEPEEIDLEDTAKKTPTRSKRMKKDVKKESPKQTKRVLKRKREATEDTIGKEGQSSRNRKRIKFEESNLKKSVRTTNSIEDATPKSKQFVTRRKAKNNNTECDEEPIKKIPFNKSKKRVSFAVLEDEESSEEDILDDRKTDKINKIEKENKYNVVEGVCETCNKTFYVLYEYKKHLLVHEKKQSEIIINVVKHKLPATVNAKNFCINNPDKFSKEYSMNYLLKKYLGKEHTLDSSFEIIEQNQIETSIHNIEQEEEEKNSEQEAEVQKENKENPTDSTQQEDKNDEKDPEIQKQNREASEESRSENREDQVDIIDEDKSENVEKDEERNKRASYEINKLKPFSENILVESNTEENDKNERNTSGSIINLDEIQSEENQNGDVCEDLTTNDGVEKDLECTQENGSNDTVYLTPEQTVSKLSESNNVLEGSIANTTVELIEDISTITTFIRESLVSPEESDENRKHNESPNLEQTKKKVRFSLEAQEIIREEVNADITLLFSES